MATDQAAHSDRIASDAPAEDIALLEDEEVLAYVKPSWVNWLGLLVLAGITGLAGVVVLLGDPVFGLVLLLLSGLLVAYVRYARERSRYIVTNQRVKKAVGLARRSTGETRITKIRGLTTHQGLLDRFVGKGNVLIDSGAASGKLGIQGVSDHEKLANTVREQQRRIENE